MEKLQSIETQKPVETKAYNPKEIYAKIQKIREQEEKQEPRKKDPEILENRLKQELDKIPD